MDSIEQDKIYEYIGVKLPLEMHGCIKAEEGALLYDFIKKFKPRKIVETGSGVSTFFILKALQDNGDGFLHSIDKFVFAEPLKHQDGDFTNREKWIEPIIKEHFSDVDWGFTKNIDSVKYLGDNIHHMDIDFFFHDSYHTPEHIRNEWMLVGNKITWFGAHNFRNKLCKPFFQLKGFTDEWKLIGTQRQLGIWRRR